MEDIFFFFNEGLTEWNYSFFYFYTSVVYRNDILWNYHNENKTDYLQLIQIKNDGLVYGTFDLYLSIS